MQRGKPNRPPRQMTVAHVLLAVSVGLLVAAGVLVQGANAGERPSPAFGQKVQPLQRATNTIGPSATPTHTPTPFGPGPTTTPTPDSTADPSLPDLVVVGMQITLESGGGCATTTELGLRVYVRNDGDGAATTVSVTANGATMDLVGGLEAGSSTSVWFPGYRYGEPNTATVDSTNVIAESDETNNMLTQMLPVPTPPRPCTATPTVDLTASPTTTVIPTTSVPGVRWYLPLLGTTREQNPTPAR